MILEDFQLRRWMFLCQGRLGDQARLWGARIVNRSRLDTSARADGTRLIQTGDPLKDPFHVYAHRFSVFVPARYNRSPSHRRALHNIIESQKPVHTLYRLKFVEPRFRIGVQASIGLDAVVGRYPEGITLEGMPLGQATVLGLPPHKRGRPSLEIGVDTRLGSSN